MNHECLSVLVNRQQFWRDYLMSVCLWKIRFKKLTLSNIKEQFWSVCPKFVWIDDRWWRLFEILTFVRHSEVSSKLCYLFKILKFVRNSDVCSKLWRLFETLTFVRNSFQLDISAHKSKAELAHKGTMSLRSRPSSEALRSAVMRRSVSAASNFSSNTVTIKYS
jgi:hypothetical protein